MAGARTLPDGYTVPLHRSLTEVILLGGAPRMAAILNGTLAAALGLGLQMWGVGIVYWLVSHGLCVWAAKRDPKFMEVLVRHVRHRRYLSC
ncbi:MAG: VirB3 family type IV secretion system protein [Pseudomonadota bacterium]